MAGENVQQAVMTVAAALMAAARVATRIAARGLLAAGRFGGTTASSFTSRLFAAGRLGTTTRRFAARRLAATLVAMEDTQQTTTMAVATAASSTRRLLTAGRLCTTAGRFTSRLLTAARGSTTSRFTTFVATTSGFARGLAAAVAPAVIQAEHAIQELKTKALAAKAYADY
jgi:hypothetical protein